MFTSGRDQLSRRNFIKAALAGISGVIAALIGIPSSAYLISPTIQSEGEDGTVIPLGTLDNFPVGIPTRFDFTRTKVNGWELTSINYGLYVVRTSKSEVRVFSDICTHLGCRVTWHPDIQHYI